MARVPVDTSSDGHHGDRFILIALPTVRYSLFSYSSRSQCTASTLRKSRCWQAHFMLCRSMRYGHCHRVLDFLLDPLSSCTYPGLTIATSSRNSRVMRSFRRLSLPVLRGLVSVWFRAVWTCATKTTTAHSWLLSWLPRAPLCCFLTTDRLADTYMYHFHLSFQMSLPSLSRELTTPRSFFLLPSAL